MSDFDTVKAAVVKTLDFTQSFLDDDLGGDWARQLSRNVAHMLPAESQCALCGRFDCRGTDCPFADVRQHHSHTVMEGRVREGAGEAADVFLCDTCDAPVCRAEWLDGHGWVRAERPREEAETCDCPYGNPCDICGQAVSTADEEPAGDVPTEYACHKCGGLRGEIVMLDPGRYMHASGRCEYEQAKPPTTARDIEELRERLARLEERVQGIQETNNLWDGT